MLSDGQSLNSVESAHLLDQSGRSRPLPVHSVTPLKSVSEPNSLALVLKPLRPFLDDASVTELCINRPGEIFLETRAGWRREALPAASLTWCRGLAKLVAHHTRQRVDETSPLLSASLPSGERMQVVLPPATSLGSVAITIRRPSDEVWTIDELTRRGVFRFTKTAIRELKQLSKYL